MKKLSVELRMVTNIIARFFRKMLDKEGIEYYFFDIMKLNFHISLEKHSEFYSASASNTLLGEKHM